MLFPYSWRSTLCKCTVAPQPLRGPGGGGPLWAFQCYTLRKSFTDIGWDCSLDIFCVSHGSPCCTFFICSTFGKMYRAMSAKRQQGNLTIEIAILCLSTLPLQTKVLVYSMSDLCKKEFMMGCMITTSVMTLKNVIVGKMLTLNPSASPPGPRPQGAPLWGRGPAISFSLVFPTLSTIYFSSSVFLLLKNMDVSRGDSEHINEPFIGKATIPEISMSVILERSEIEYDEEETITISTVDNDDPDKFIVTQCPSGSPEGLWGRGCGGGVVGKSNAHA